MRIGVATLPLRNLNENFNEVLPKFLIFDEVLDEILDF